MVKNDALYYIKRALWRSILSNPFSIRFAVQLLRIGRITKNGNRIRLSNEKKHRTNIPPVCILSVTKECNISCKGCYAVNHSVKDELNLKEIDEILRESIDLGIYVFIIVGGEPLMKKNIFHVLHKYPNALFLVFTNGLLINKDTIESFKNTSNLIPVVSFEGNKYFNQLRRGKNGSNLMDKSLRLLQKSKIIYGFSSVAFSENVEYITSEEYFDKMKSYGMKFGFIIDYMSAGNRIEESMVMNDAELEEKRRSLDLRRNNTNTILFNLPMDEELFGNCGAAGKLLIHINAHGEVEPCVFCKEANDNIKEKPLIEILKSEFFRKVREEIDQKSFTGKCYLCQK